MTSFSNLTWQMLKQKVKYTYLVLVIQVIATIIFTVMNQEEYRSEGFQNILYNNSLLLTILFDVIFLAIMCWRNEKINLSQTWRQIPISNSKFYISNIMSTLLACAYWFIIQIVLNMLISIPRIDRIFNDLVGLPDGMGWYKALTFVVFLVLIVVMISTFVSFTNFLTRIIVDILPVRNTLWAKMLVMGILIIVAAYIAVQINDHFTNFLVNHIVQNAMVKTNITEAGSLGVTNLEFLLISIVLGGLDLWFINKFVEAKIRN